MKLFLKQLIRLSLILLPITLICVLLNKQVDLYNLINGIETVQIVEDIENYKDFLKDYDFSNAPVIDSFDNFVNFISFYLEWFGTIIILTINVIIVSPIRTLLDIFNLLFV